MCIPRDRLQIRHVANISGANDANIFLIGAVFGDCILAVNYCGIDLGGVSGYVHITTDRGRKLWSGPVETTKEECEKRLRRFSREGLAIAIEAGKQTAWVYEVLVAMGAKVTVVNPNKVKLIAESRRKTDKVDARILCELLRIDALPYPVHMQIAHLVAIDRHRDTQLLQSWFNRVAKRRGKEMAVVALARRLLVIVYHLLREETEYDAPRLKRWAALAERLGEGPESPYPSPRPRPPSRQEEGGGEPDGDESETEGNQDQRSSEKFVAL